jgi:hypothetical protein
MDEYTMQIENKNNNTEINNLLPETPFIFEVKATKSKYIVLQIEPHKDNQDYYYCSDIEKGIGFGKLDYKFIVDAINDGFWILKKSKLIIE